MEQRIADIIEQLKKVRIERGLSYQEIVDKCEENGEAVSMSTVKRVFAADSEASGFRYDTTIQPIARVVLGLDDSDGTNSEISALKSMNELKDDMILTLNKTIDAKDQELSRLMKASKTQIDSRNESVDYLKMLVDRQRRTVIINRTMSILLLLLIIFGLLVDKINPNIGFFWVG